MCIRDRSADDFHAITVAFKQIYSKPWMNTGASKGGMTSVYHKYFYPNDLAGTLANVAPLSFDRGDRRYVNFLRTVGVGKYSQCRNNLKRLQIQALENKAGLSLKLTPIENTLMGDKESAIAGSAQSLFFVFWQYQKVASGCNEIANIQDNTSLFNYLVRVASPSTKKSFNRFKPYYFQAYTQLGYPGSYVDHLSHLLTPGEESFEALSQAHFDGYPLTYSNNEMYLVQNWAKLRADKMMYIYGEFDPWTAAPFPTSLLGKETYKLSLIHI